MTSCVDTGTSAHVWTVAVAPFADSLMLTRSDGNYIYAWTYTGSSLDFRFSVYCFAAMPAAGPMLQGGSINERELLPSSWLFVDPVTDSSSSLGISFIAQATWMNNSKEILVNESMTYGCVANMEPSRVELQIEDGHERLYIPFTSPYSKPPLCMTRELNYGGFYITTMTSVNGIYLWSYVSSNYFPWSESQHWFATFCFGGMQPEASRATSGQRSDTVSTSYVGIPSFWTVFNWEYDGALAMGASLMSCTWNATDEKLIGCGDSKQSYGGVANMDVRNAKLEESGAVLKVTFIRSYAKVPYCFISENQIEKLYYVLEIRAAVDRGAVSFRRTVVGDMKPWSSSTLHSSFTVLCFGVMA